MTEQEQKAFDAMRDALENIAGDKWPDPEMTAEEYAREALTAANAVSESQGCPDCGAKIKNGVAKCPRGGGRHCAVARMPAEPQAQGDAVVEAESIMRDLYDANQHWARTEKRKAAVYRFRQFQAKNYDPLNLDVANVKQQREMTKYPCNKCNGTGREEHYNLETSDMDYEQCSECAGTGDADWAAHPQATEPAGWKRVPVEPTSEMTQAAMTSWMTRRPFKEVYKSLLAAAPEAP